MDSSQDMSAFNSLVVVHHTACLGSFEDFRLERASRGEGYHVLIASDGRFFLDCSIYQKSWGAYGCDALRPTLNVALIGNFDPVSNPSGPVPSPAAINCLVQFLAVKLKNWGWCAYDVSDILGHRDIGASNPWELYVTACPGDRLYSLLPEIRKRISKYLPDHTP